MIKISLVLGAASAAKALLLSALVGVASAAPTPLISGVLDEAATPTSAWLRTTQVLNPPVGYYGMVQQEMVQVRLVNGRLNTVTRGVAGTVKASHPVGSVVWFGPLGAFVSMDLSGACDVNTVDYEPLVSTASGSAYACQGGTWVAFAPGSGISGDASTNTSTSVDGEIALFAGTFGKTIRRGNALTGVLKTTSGVASVVTGTGTDCVKVNGTSGSCGGSPAWGAITGTLSSQTDLQTALNGKVAGPGTSVDSEVILFSGTGGATAKRATGTGVPKLTSGVLSLVTGTSTDCVKVDGTSGACGGGGSTGLVPTKTSSTVITVSAGSVVYDGAPITLAQATFTLRQYSITSATAANPAVLTISGGLPVTAVTLGQSLAINGVGGTGFTALNGVQQMTGLAGGPPFTSATVNVNTTGATGFTAGTAGYNASASGNCYIYATEAEIAMECPDSQGMIIEPSGSGVSRYTTTPAYPSRGVPIGIITLVNTSGGQWGTLTAAVRDGYIVSDVLGTGLERLAGVLKVTTDVTRNSATNAITGTFTADNAAAIRPIKQGSADPGTCVRGEAFLNTTTGVAKDCTATNTWTARGGGASFGGKFEYLSIASNGTICCYYSNNYQANVTCTATTLGGTIATTPSCGGGAIYLDYTIPPGWNVTTGTMRMFARLAVTSAGASGNWTASVNARRGFAGTDATANTLSVAVPNSVQTFDSAWINIPKPTGLASGDVIRITLSVAIGSSGLSPGVFGWGIEFAN